MKKFFSLFLISLSMLMLTSCESTTGYSYYTISTGTWSGTTDEDVFTLIQTKLTSMGYIVGGFTLEGDDMNGLDEQAIAKFEALVESLDSDISTIADALKGNDAAPCTVKFLYSLNRGTDVTYLLSSEVFEIEIEE
ncbi:MAG: hypothetical protein R3Y19_02770 [Rikenellaceae bacterium]